MEFCQSEKVGTLMGLLLVYLNLMRLITNLCQHLLTAVLGIILNIETPIFKDKFTNLK